MASLGNTPSGRRYVQFRDRHNVRRTLALGHMPKASAEKVRGHVAALVVAAMTNTAPPRDTALWLADLPDKLYGKLHALRLVAARAEQAVPELAAVWDAYVGRRPDFGPTSKNNFKQCRKWLVAFFGARRDVRTITRGEAADWARKLRERYAAATVAMHVKKARQVFDDAASRKVIEDNPFRAVKAGSQANPERMVYVKPEVVDAVIKACPDDEWRLIFALARYGGLRVPSEPNALRWRDVDWAAQRITVNSPKTGRRVIPLFYELVPYLAAVRNPDDEPGDHVIRKHRGENLRTTGEKIVERANVERWGKLFQNLRASRETDLLDSYPIQTACQWIGNSEAVARKHYLMVKDVHFDRAVGKSAAPGAAPTSGQEGTMADAESRNTRENRGEDQTQVPSVGIEPTRPLPGSGF